MTTLKTFTAEECNKALMLVNPIVHDIVRKRTEMNEIKTKERISPNQYTKERTKKLAKQIIYHLEELETIGCFLKDFETGEVNFPSYQGKRLTRLKWKLGEEAVQ